MLANVGKWFAEVLIQIIAGLIQKWIESEKKKKEIQDKATKDQEARDNAKTPDEKAKAATRTAHDTFS